jgi:LysM repeat protein/ribosomal protein L40E
MCAERDMKVNAMGLHLMSISFDLGTLCNSPPFGIIRALMSDSTNIHMKTCLQCGSRTGGDAKKCSVCGHQFTQAAPGSTRGKRGASSLSGNSIPQFNLSLPLAIGMLLMAIIIGAGLTYFGLSQSDRIAVPTGIPSITPSPSITATSAPETPTLTSTPFPTLPPSSYTVQQNDTCGSVAAIFNVSVQSIVLQNALNADCSLFIGQVLSVPQPTYTPTPESSPTLSELQATIEACDTEIHVVQEGDTLSLISLSYGVPLEAIQEWNGLTSDTAFFGQRLIIPYCERVIVAGETVTPTVAPPYPASELLLPADGASFDLSNDIVTLQWSSVGTLRNNEAYQVTVIDVTGGLNERVIEEVIDTKFIVPAAFRPSDGQPHVFRWFVVPVAQIGVDSEGLPVYSAGGAISESRVFTWIGAGATDSSSE